MSVRVRIAPSPTGNLHIGTARTAVFNWLFARNQGGTFILRIEDTDQERSRPEYTDNILAGLKWLGLDWDEGPLYQTQRMDLYRAAVQQLLDQGSAYPCYCTSEELEAMREAQKARKEAPRYDNRHRDLTPEQRAAFEAEGREPVIRFKIEDDRIIQWDDLVRGTVTWKGSDLGGDMVIARRAPAGTLGLPLYNFVVVVDDADMAITHVIRGEDHIANTGKQILLYEALGKAIPQFAHTPLILNAEGRKLSKRDGVTSVADFEAMGYTADALANYMGLLGWSPPEPMTERFTLAEAATAFGFERVNRAGAKFDWDKLNWLNAQVLHGIPAEQLLEELLPLWQAAGYEFAGEGDASGGLSPDSTKLGGADRPWLLQLTQLIAPSLVKINDGVGQAALLGHETVEIQPDAAALLQQVSGAGIVQGVLEAIAQQPVTSSEVAKQIIDQVTQTQAVKKGIVMRSLRAALMGSLQGPDLVDAWLLLNQRGWDKSRLEKAIAVATQA
ncbi:MAG: glutamate--tRNA ligase [Synechococcales cyanobacterium CRU_2_2]|nr:glutamate--tRNA ligase [Synechococcales cyanobacterium CRU_2_2]